MTETALTSERILEAAEDVLRRFGPTKATVIDVARALDVSHGSVYSHFPSKAALRDAVAERWLARISHPLEDAAAEKTPAPERARNDTAQSRVRIHPGMTIFRCRRRWLRTDMARNGRTRMSANPSPR